MKHDDTRYYVGEIDSLQKFLEKLEELRNNSYEKLVTKGEYYFRGENSLYQNIISGGLRNQTLNLPCMISEYQREVEHSISEKEYSMILAHAQHHGLPTNLIDITENPLVSLYFACQPSEHQYGAVHLFRKTDFISITNNNFVLSSGQFTSNFFKVLDDKITLSEKFYELADILKNKGDYIDRVNESIFDTLKNIEQKNNVNGPNHDVIEFMNQLKKALFDEGVLPINNNSDIDEVVGNYNKAVSHFLPEFKKRHLNERIIRTNSYYGEEYLLCMLLSLFNQIDDRGDIKENSPRFTKFIYKPNMPFKRGISQSGSFIFQPYEQAIFELPDAKNLFDYRKSYFRIVSEFKILIPKSSAQKILVQLDQVGINQKTIYGDFDNISQYIVSKQ
ncbi:FRG domain-containing protein [Lactococcus lactis]|uniref:FRG domain-containing protein n=1 Tax=Lactococcus lactis TaxID=1358 RepID=UPI001BA82B6F|nr:FRG domain-containing protein [Lactococcus lactis]MBR8678632.1 FRG domain-containing protein [Lactococcus lactis subsp. lactis]MBR8680941.1 FRG domain-containing protein [Lactococcus lactis subsp. lactis]MBR8686066.1 FRG domain-containing protein [Lactococcus lactis subsp. lactis]